MAVTGWRGRVEVDRERAEALEVTGNTTASVTVTVTVTVSLVVN